MTKQERAQRARQRPHIIKAILHLERTFGEGAVSGAYNRHRAIRSERRKLERQRKEIAAKIAKLSR